ncbi:tetratricopeptide repeat protein [Alteromonadaceae bacterium M269]|nr:tetratricopeptide repeat protein [Alteromonadaceae bacterium M269]
MQPTDFEKGFYIGAWLIEPKLNRISSEGEEGDIQNIVTPKVMALCLLLAQKQREPVSQQEIAEHVWPNLAISDSSIYQAIAQLRKALNDTQVQKHYIERVSGKGYRLIKAVRLKNGDKSSDNSVLNQSSMTTEKAVANKSIVAAVFALIILVSLVIFYTLDSMDSTESPNDLYVAPLTISSIAIRPTENLTQPKLQELDSFSHLLLSDLLSLPDISLVLIRDEAQETTADVELLHSISSNGNDLLLSAQLLERVSSNVIWAEDFVFEKDALFDLKSQVSSSLMSILSSDTTDTQTTLLTKSSLPKEQYESFVLAQYLWNKREPSTLLEAQKLFEEILKQQPDDLETLVGLCNTYLFLHTYSSWTKEQAYSTCTPLITKASDIAPDDGKVLATRALLASDVESDSTDSLFEAAIKQAPNYAEAYLWYGNHQRWKGNVNEALALHQKALSLDPLSPNINRSLAYSYLNLRRLEEAKQYYQRALTIEPNYSLRPVEELDFLPLNKARAKRFLKWSETNASNLGKRAPYLLTQALVRLGLGQIKQARQLVEQADPQEVNDAFMLYTKAALNSSEGNLDEALVLLEERYLKSLQQQANTNRHAMPYLSLLLNTGQYEKAYQLFKKHFPQIQKGGEITGKNSGQFTFLYALLQANKLDTDRSIIKQRLNDYFANTKEPNLSNAYIEWLLINNQMGEAKAAIEKMFSKGWLPDFNDNILAEKRLKTAYLTAGGEENAFTRLLESNRRF